MKLLLITERINQEDDDLAFHVLWAKEFIRQGVDVEAICLKKGVFDNSFPVHSLGKEEGANMFTKLFRFMKLIVSLKYDRVLVLMNPEYVSAGSWWWILKRIPVYLWYTHYAMHIHVRIASKVCTHMFAATEQSLPQFSGNPINVVLGHGIDLQHWLGESKKEEKNEKKLLAVHRICRSKRIELSIESLLYLDDEYTLTIYGRDLDKEYLKELQALVEEKGLQERVEFMGAVPMDTLREVYPKHSILLNMASETIDKTMLEAMLFGIYPVTTMGNSKAIGLPEWPNEETPEAIARFVTDGSWKKYTQDDLTHIVKERHSHENLIRKIIAHMNKQEV